MNNYQSNSHRSKAESASPVPEAPKTENKRAPKVVQGAVKVKKKNAVRRMADAFLPDDIARIKEYFFGDVLVPTVKNLISATVNTLLWNNARGNGGSGAGASQTPYGRYYENNNGGRANTATRSMPVQDCRSIVFRDRRDAEHVLTQMDDLMATYGVVRIADVFDMAGMSCDWTCNDYGWYNVRNAAIVATHEGFIIDMPRAVPIRK